MAVTVNRKTTTSAPFAPTGHIYVYAPSGNDVIKEVANSQGATVTIPAILFAGTGNSTLSVAGSSAGNVLVGGSGSDNLTGGSGQDILIGGSGASSLHAGQGGDVLIGGSTLWVANISALSAVLAEWSRQDLGFPNRVHDLFGDGSDGLNGSYLLDSQTVHLDTAIMQLVGAKSGEDWFWLSGRLKATSKISGYANGDVTTFE